MMPYTERFPVGSLVKIASRSQLVSFYDTWKYHNPILPEQIAYCGIVAVVESISFYHGGDVLYRLRDIPGIWHEQCLEQP